MATILLQGRNVPISSFVMFLDGVVIDASKTDDAEEFWGDLSEWMIVEKKFEILQSRQRSVLLVRSSQNLMYLCQSL